MSSPETTPQSIEETLFDAIAEIGPDRSDITREATLGDLDIDSLDLVEIAQLVQETWGVELDPQEFIGVKTVGEALDMIASRVLVL
jgi:acyl carrier protein